MNSARQLYEHYNDVRNPMVDPLLLATGITRTDLLKILAVLMLVEEQS